MVSILCKHSLDMKMAKQQIWLPGLQDTVSYNLDDFMMTLL